MKKLLNIFGTIFLIFTMINVVIGCKPKGTVTHETDEDSDQTKDVEVLHEIINEISDNFTNYSINNSYINSEQHKTQFAPFYGLALKDKSKVNIMATTEGVDEAIAIINDGFESVFDDLNREIQAKYSNFYFAMEPMTLERDKITYTLQYIDVAKLGEIAKITVENTNAVALHYNVNYTVRYKKLVSAQQFTLKYIITDNLDIMTPLLNGTIEAVSIVIRDYFANNKIILSETSAYKTLYNNFDINYAQEHARLDNLVQFQLNNDLKAVPNISSLYSQLTWNVNEKLLDLETSILDKNTNGQSLYGNSNNDYSHWAGEGYGDDKLTVENFVDFYKTKMLKIDNNIEDIPIATFKVNLSRITIAGCPMFGIVTDAGVPISVPVIINKNDFQTKLVNFGKIVVALIKMFHIQGHWQFHISASIWDKVTNIYFLKNEVWKLMRREFRASLTSQQISDATLFTFNGEITPYTFKGNHKIFHFNSFHLNLKFGGVTYNLVGDPTNHRDTGKGYVYFFKL
ncbi:hypothetical protein S100390_v1c07340 [Spiroplasma sp. NBRC 100390]|uniref:hypothetical protein n=1 Tax=unclassified Spiroplasma TaxID=2637901 RepID=UPI000892A083|nr:MULTISPECIES: hypothetical protein [unclassified Spiroplasma]AOX44070.1 hypothetical protein STU14_v1c07340 [Spiroplasma sp. TU-14]APE13540.1 hypothetical protein S100390_v1c07340 [Spiroplasma sp. NBRC 100390]